MTLAEPQLIIILLAPIIGSFLGVVIRRLPEHRPLVVSRSACEACGHTLGPRDLVPLLSYAALRGRCRRCRAPIGRFHPAVELAALAIAVVGCLAIANPLRLWLGVALGWVLLTLAWIDWRHTRLPDVLTLPLLLAGLAATCITAPDDLTDHAAASAVGYLAFFGLNWLYRRVRRRDGLGRGDAKLLAAGGAWVGLAALPSVVLIAALATLAAAALRGGTLTRATAVPFGPGLAMAIWAVWLAG